MADDLNPTSMLYWWPLVLPLDVPKPRTEIIVTEPEEAAVIMLLCEEHRGDRETEEHRGCASRIDRYVPQIVSAVLRVDGFAAFLRTDLFSGKHFYERTCHLPDEASVGQHVWDLLEAQEMAFFPPPPNEDLSVRGFVVRELLPIEPIYTAWGGLPITAERRYFVSDGEVQCHHPYWDDEQNIGQGFRGGAKPEDWLDKLRAVNAESPAEVNLLTYRSRRVAEVLPGAWSVDWLRTRDGEWYLIDMATAERSWHPEHDRAIPA